MEFGIARTRAECAEALGVHVRFVASWLNDPTFPGSVGYFPVRRIKAWLAAETSGRRAGVGVREQLAEIKAERDRMGEDNLTGVEIMAIYDRILRSTRDCRGSGPGV